MIARPHSDEVGDSLPDPMKFDLEGLSSSNPQHRLQASSALIELYKLHKVENRESKIKKIKKKQKEIVEFLNFEKDKR